MATETLTENQQQRALFAALPTEVLPEQYCVGTVTAIQPFKLTASGFYIRAGFQVRPIGSGSSAFGGFMAYPDWLHRDFDPSKFNQKDPQSKSASFVYGSNIAPDPKTGKISILEGLAGSPERSIELQTQIVGVTDRLKVSDAGYLDALNTVFSNFILPDGKPATDSDGDEIQIGYVLKQKREKDPETGKNTVLMPGYQFDSFFYPTEAIVKGLRERVEKKGDIIVTF